MRTNVKQALRGLILAGAMAGLLAGCNQQRGDSQKAASEPQATGDVGANGQRSASGTASDQGSHACQYDNGATTGSAPAAPADTGATAAGEPTEETGSVPSGATSGEPEGELGAEGRPGETGAPPTAAGAATTGAGAMAPSTPQDAAGAIWAINTCEVEMGKVARNKATSSEVKQFAAMMVKDHDQASTRLKSVARKAGMKLEMPTEAAKAEAPTGEAAAPAAGAGLMGQLKMECDQRLQQLRNAEKGQTFEQQYMQIMVEDHERAAQMLTSARQAVSEHKELQGFVDELLPKIKDHHTRAQQIAGGTGETRAKTEGSGATTR